MSRKKIMTSVYLERTQDERLKRLAKATKVPAAALLREALDDLLEKRKDEIPPAEPDPRQLEIEGARR